MHSNIYGIITKREYDIRVSAGEETILDYADELPHFADYVSDVDDIQEAIGWLKEHFTLGHKIPESLFSIDMTEQTIKFMPGFKEAYFAEAWQNLVKCVLNSNAYADFCGISGNGLTARIKRNLEEDYGFYVADEYSCYETMDSFIRRIQVEETYKIFDIVDYHF